MWDSVFRVWGSDFGVRALGLFRVYGFIVGGLGARVDVCQKFEKSLKQHEKLFYKKKIIIAKTSEKHPIGVFSKILMKV